MRNHTRRVGPARLCERRPTISPRVVGLRSKTRWSHPTPFTWYIVIAVFSVAASAVDVYAQDAKPASDTNVPVAPLRIFEQEPYDLLRFKDGKETKVQPLPLKTRKLPDKP